MIPAHGGRTPGGTVRCWRGRLPDMKINTSCMHLVDTSWHDKFFPQVLSLLLSLSLLLFMSLSLFLMTLLSLLLLLLLLMPLARQGSSYVLFLF